MSYINQFKLIQEKVRKRRPDAKKLLTEVDRKAVERALKRTKGGIPKPIACTYELKSDTLH